MLDFSRTFHPFPLLSAELRQLVWAHHFSDIYRDIRLPLPSSLFPHPLDPISATSTPQQWPPLPPSPPPPHFPFFLPRECLLSRTTYFETLPIMLSHSRPILSTRASSAYFTAFLLQTPGLTALNNNNGFWYITSLHFKIPDHSFYSTTLDHNLDFAPFIDLELLAKCPNLTAVYIQCDSRRLGRGREVEKALRPVSRALWKLIEANPTIPRKLVHWDGKRRSSTIWVSEFNPEDWKEGSSVGNVMKFDFTTVSAMEEEWFPYMW